VVPLQPPAPGPARRRLAEDAEVVVLRIAEETSVRALDLPEHLLEAHDRGGLHHAAVPEGRRHHRVRQGLLVWLHLAEGQTVAIARDVVPVEALLVVEVEPHLGRLFRSEGLEERLGRRDEVGNRLSVIEGDSAGREECDQNDGDLAGRHGYLLRADIS
jgi:hypothetical protein